MAQAQISSFSTELSRKQKLFYVATDLHYIHKLFRWFKFTLKPPYSIAHDKLRLAIWDTSFWTFWLKFGHKGP